jgi:hypothetical protein
MVNSKKMSKSSIAVIVLAILLALSMVLGLTGAWFTATDSDDANTTIKFGTVAIKVSTEDGNTGAWTSKSTVEGEYMPGDSYAATMTLKNTGTQDVYYKVIAVAEVTKKDDTSAKEVVGITVKIDQTATGNEVVTDSGIYELATGKTVNFPASLKLETSLGNTFQGEEYSITLKVTIQAVQKANFDPATETWPSFEA